MSSTFLIQFISAFLLLTLFIGVIGRQNLTKALERLYYSIYEISQPTSNSIIAFGHTLTKYFNATDIELAQYTNKILGSSNIIDTFTAEDIEENNQPMLANRIKIEKIAGASLGLFSFTILIYAGNVLIYNLLVMLGVAQTTPALLVSNISAFYQLLILLLGIVIPHGLFIADLVGTSSFTPLRTTSKANKKTYRNIMLLSIFCIVGISIILTVTQYSSIENLIFLIYPLLAILLFLTASLAFLFITGTLLIIILAIYALGYLITLLNNILRVLLAVNIAFVSVFGIFFENITNLFKTKK